MASALACDAVLDRFDGSGANAPKLRQRAEAYTGEASLEDAE